VLDQGGGKKLGVNSNVDSSIGINRDAGGDSMFGGWWRGTEKEEATTTKRRGGKGKIIP